MSVKLYCADCLDILPTMESKSIDVVIADPIYGNGTEYNGTDDSQEELERLISGSIDHLLRISDRVLITCGVGNIHLYPKPDWTLAWVTPAGSGSSKWGFCCWQPILAYGKDPYLQNGLGRRPDAIVWTEISKPNGHPCPKPEGFMKWLVERGSLTGETILDPFMGSGTTGVAALKLGRNFIGIEKDPSYFSIAEKRIKWAEDQPALLQV